MSQESRNTVWTFTGLRGVDLGSLDPVELGSNFFLTIPSPLLLSVRHRHDMSEREWREIEDMDCFLVLSDSHVLPHSDVRGFRDEILQNGLVAVQILKPVQSFGFIFQASKASEDQLNLQRITHRPPMEAGEWAQMRRFDQEFLSDLPTMIRRVNCSMTGGPAETKNAIILYQLALEHRHPLIAGLLSVAGMEAIFDSADRNDFKAKLCRLLGPATPAFPNWNASLLGSATHTVEEVALPLYILRSKLAHGVDLRKAAHDPKTPVDLLESVNLIEDLPPRARAILLSEAALYLLARVIRKVI